MNEIERDSNVYVENYKSKINRVDHENSRESNRKLTAKVITKYMQSNIEVFMK